MKTFHFPTILFVMLSLAAQSQINHWESVVLPGDTWSYQVPTSQPAADWTQIDFDDAQWSQGPSGIGYGDDDDQTVIDATMAVYMRIGFTIVSLAEVEQLLLDMDYDDGFVAYLNGTEIARSLVSGEPPAFDQPSDGLHEAQLYTGADPERHMVDRSLLIEGANILAVEVHNESLTSSDLTAIPTMSVGINTTTNHYRSVPDWFDEPVEQQDIVLETSNLPIVIIHTAGGQTIPNEPKIRATMTIIDNGPGQDNAVTDSSNPESLDYDGNIEIEIRGSSSNCCSDKKQYALTTYDEANEKDNVSLFGMPKENDWILNGFAFDPSLMRDYIAYQLSLKIGEYASRGRYCEVILNGDYMGVYVLQEKLKADDNRIDINKIEPEDKEGKALTGGYITKSDKTEGSDVAAWYMDNYSGWQTAFVHEHPKPTTVTASQNNYIREIFFNLETQAFNNNDALVGGYPSIIDIPSFVDFMIMNELASNADAYQFSTFFHKDRNGKLRAGPLWDFNLTFGNDLFFWGLDRSHTDVWQFDDGDNVGARFWRDLFQDPTFHCYFSKRWLALTAVGQPLHPDAVNSFIDEVFAETQAAAERNHARWGIGEDRAEHVALMKQWVMDRVDWITSQLGNGQACKGESVSNLVITRINYHPMTEDGKDEKDLEFIEITNTGSTTIDLTGVYFGGTGLVYQFPPNITLGAGSSVYLANEADAFKEAYGFNPFDEFSRSLNNGGQTITLLNGYGMTIDEVTYLDEAPWPTEADGDGYFLSVIDPTADNNDPSNWKADNVLDVDLLGAQPLDFALSVFPNPTSNNIQITSKRQLVSVRVFDLQGRLLQSIPSGGATSTIDVSHFERGVYLLEIQTDTQLYRRKVVIE
ncbi:MAG: CotH kinase family protein [Marinoscillum sp.]|uniref:CotH kinase family protein n=1 Tax=Marinoscillum sp. TaxID=2024838 RepID=UPI0032FB0EF6